MAEPQVATAQMATMFDLDELKEIIRSAGNLGWLL